MVTVTESNPQAFKVLNARLKELETKILKVGWFESAKYENGTPVAYAAYLNEFGRYKRPFFRPAVMEKGSEWIETAARCASAVLAGQMTVDQAMEIIGLQIEGDVHKSIANVYSPPLSKITLMARKYREEGKPVTGRTIGEIARLIKEGKGRFSSNTKPLNDSGLMDATLTHVVEDSR